MWTISEQWDNNINTNVYIRGVVSLNPTKYERDMSNEIYRRNRSYNTIQYRTHTDTTPILLSIA